MEHGCIPQIAITDGSPAAVSRRINAGHNFQVCRCVAVLSWTGAAQQPRCRYRIDAIDRYEQAVAAAASANLGSPERENAPQFAKLGNPTCHERVRELHADVSSAAAEIYAASVMLSRTMYLSYVNEELGIPYELPIEIAVDNTTAIAFASGTVKKSKMRHIDARQDWVQALRDGDLVKLVKVDTKNNLADLGTKVLDPDTFERLRDCMMVCHPIPAADLELGSRSNSGAPAAPMSTQRKALPDEVSADCVQVAGQTRAAQTATEVPARCGVRAPQCTAEVPDIGMTRAPRAGQQSVGHCSADWGTVLHQVAWGRGSPVFICQLAAKSLVAGRRLAVV